MKTNADSAEKTPTAVDPGVRHFTYDEVKAILCEGCNLKISEVRECDERKFYHTLNGLRTPCFANDWRNKANA
jgi:hypothetical protein